VRRRRLGKALRNQNKHVLGALCHEVWNAFEKKIANLNVNGCIRLEWKEKVAPEATDGCNQATDLIILEGTV
jgi:hypothetical protein